MPRFCLVSGMISLGTGSTVIVIVAVVFIIIKIAADVLPAAVATVIVGVVSGALND